MPRGSLCIVPLQKGLKIRSDDLVHPTDRCIMHKIVYPYRPMRPVQADGLHHRIETDSVTELKAIDKRLLRTVYGNVHPVEYMGHHTLCKRFAGKPVGLDRWIIQTGFLRYSLDVKPRLPHVIFTLLIITTMRIPPARLAPFSNVRNYLIQVG